MLACTLACVSPNGFMIYIEEDHQQNIMVRNLQIPRANVNNNPLPGHGEHMVVAFDEEAET